MKLRLRHALVWHCVAALVEVHHTYPAPYQPRTYQPHQNFNKAAPPPFQTQVRPNFNGQRGGLVLTLPLTPWIKPVQHSTQGLVLIIQPISLYYTCADIVFALLESIVTTQLTQTSPMDTQKINHLKTIRCPPTLASVHDTPAAPHMLDTGLSPKLTPPTPDHTALHNKINIAAKQHADVSGVSHL